MRWWPRTIRWKMLVGLVVLEALSISLFAVLLIRMQEKDVRRHAQERLASQATSVASQAQEALLANRPDWLGLAVRMMGKAPSVEQAKVTDPSGNILYVSPGIVTRTHLEPDERAQMALAHGMSPRIFSFGNDRWEGVEPIYFGKELRGFAWVESDRDWDRAQLLTVARGTLIFGVIWIVTSTLLVWFMSRFISRPLAILHEGTRALMTSPQGSEMFPLPSGNDDEFGDLIEAFNRMVDSIEEQRSGLNDTLSLLDSMLANAPIGLAFFDTRRRCVRVNHVFAELTEVPLNRYLGKTLTDLVPGPVGTQLEEAVGRAFTLELPDHELEIEGLGSKAKDPWTWLVSTYPIRTAAKQVRWVGVIVQDISQRKRSEEALRKSEKLAATGRLAASIAHEVNNPLEAITNLLYLLRNFCNLDEVALNYVTMAEREGKRIAEIAQQTLRFYRQSTLPQRAKMSDLLDSILDLYHGRFNALNIQVDRRYDPDLDLFCFAGEIRQVLANLVGNAVDATSSGGRLVVKASRSRRWKAADLSGVRITVADTGLGMEEGVRTRVFEAFFTTKEATGTGLGLWVSHEIILKHRGIVHVRSTPEGTARPSGTVFQVFIPDDETLTYSPRPSYH